MNRMVTVCVGSLFLLFAAVPAVDACRFARRNRCYVQPPCGCVDVVGSGVSVSPQRVSCPEPGAIYSTIDRCRTVLLITFVGWDGRKEIDVTVHGNSQWVTVPFHPEWTQARWHCTGAKYDVSNVPKGTGHLRVQYDGREIIAICCYR
jgi:hypothetical protein